jgi:RNA polymerase sigma factor (sigma-70 family)
MSSQDSVAPSSIATFDDVYERERVPMLRLAYLMLGTTELAEDVVQECFTELYRRWDSVVVPGAYVRRSVINRCSTTQRRRASERDVVSRLRVDEHSPPDEPLWELLGELPARQRSAIVCVYYLGLSSDEAAAEIGCAAATVRSLVKRALASIRKEYQT